MKGRHTAASALRAARVAANVAKGRRTAEALSAQLRASLGPAEFEVRFHPVRRWRFDLAWPAHRIAVEIEGGAFVGGAHVRGAHFRGDCEKYNEAACLGWRVLRVLPEWVRSGRAAAWVRMAAESTKSA